MKKIAKLFFILTSGLLVLSCVEKIGDEFDRDASQRVQQAMEEAHKALVSKDKGWIMQYYPDPTRQYGGFMFLMNFDKDGFVTVTSEIAKDPAKYDKSTFGINASSGPVLTFDTFNKYFHYFSDPDGGQGEGVGSGFLGDFEFYIKEASDTGILLKGIKTENYIHMIPFPEDREWNEYMKEFVENKTKIMESGAASFLWDGGTYPVELNIVRNMPVLSFMDPALNDPNIQIEIPFVYTLDGIRFYSPQEIYGVTMEEFKWDSQTASYISTDGTVTLKGEKVSNYQRFDQFIGNWRMTTSSGSYNLTLAEQENEGDVRLLEERTFTVSGLHNDYEPLEWIYSWSDGTVSWPPQVVGDYEEDDGTIYPLACFLTDGSFLAPSTNKLYSLYSTNVSSGGRIVVNFDKNENDFDPPFGMAFFIIYEDSYTSIVRFMQPSMTKQ